MAEEGKASRAEHLVAWVRRWGRLARVGGAAVRTPAGRLIGALLLVPVVVLVLVIIGIVRALTG
ncbi:hypothetical protein [Myceligenerans pegani]|uniref:Uncharacterized protein n=1 Tax=Myceligenerans pegani TaxID=2776917 RepID=A0ABR9MZM0_9MICO|nr:hypothetical protein [Myceligenerans sp. TRM 65318]MBE1876838.1 hypothetical protein [Myceligenerans sp. TRM 65318]MBE3019109.1 hypothetical protein [Myceligenerans sp. TRM 65318]